MARTTFSVVLPLAGVFLIWEGLGGEVTLSKLMLLVAAILPVIAIGWLGYQSFRRRPPVQ